MTLQPQKNATLVALATLLLFVPVLVQSEDWGAWRGKNRNSISTEKGLATAWTSQGPQQVWKYKTGKSYTTVSVAKGRLVTMGAENNIETVYCLNAKSGDLVWKYSYNHPKREIMADPNPTASSATPVIDGDRVYTINREGLALCLTLKDGKVVWSKELTKEADAKQPQFGFSGAPVIEGNTIYYNAGANGVALEKSSGKVLWSSGAGPAGYATSVLHTVDGTKLVVNFNGDGLIAAEAETGKKLWFIPWKTQFNTYSVDAVFFGDKVFLTTYGSAKLYKLTENKPTLVYESKFQSNFNNPVLVGNYLYGASKGYLTCMNLETGEETWRERGIGQGSVIVADGKLIVLSEQGELSLLSIDPKAYNLLTKAKVMEGKCWAAPVLVNGLLYCRNNDGELICLNLRKN